MKRKVGILERMFDRCNLIGEEVDILAQIYRCRTTYFESDEVHEAIYNYIADRMGLSNEDMLTQEQMDLLKNAGYM